MEKPQTFSEWIATYLALLKDRGHTQAEVARRMRVHPSLLTKWKVDDYGDKPTFDNVTAFADVARLTPQQRVDLLRAAGYDVSISTVLDAPEYVAARERYLSVLRERYSKAHTGAFWEAIARDARVGQARRPDLLGDRGIYVPLLLDPLGERLDVHRSGIDQPDATELERQRPQTWAEVLNTPGHLAIIGRAGCGKTTLLRVLTAVMAAGHPATIAPDIARALPQPRPLPIFLPLRAFEYACSRGEYCRDLENLLRFIDDWVARWTDPNGWPKTFLEDHLRSGRAWLLLDALDEVANPEDRKTVRNILLALADLLAGSRTRLIVTARVAAYSTAQLYDFGLFQVRDLDDEQRGAMAHAIYRGLDVSDAESNAAYLEERLRQSEALHALVRTPVMLWTAAVVHTLRGKLPETRAALYTAYVDILLRHSYSQHEGDTGTLESVVGEHFSTAERHEYLTYAAFEAHRRLETRAEQRATDRPALSNRELVEEILGPYLERFDDPETARQKARQYLTLMVEHSGLLVETDAGYIFGDHLTMQEFLAGCYLGAKYTRYDDVLQKAVGNSWWKEVLLFAVGYLAEDRARSSDTPDLLYAIAGDTSLPPERRLVHLTVAGEALLQLRARVQRPSWYGGLAQRFATALHTLLFLNRVQAPLPVRQEAGLVLGRLYGFPGESGSLQDPRFVGPLGLPDFVEIPAGTFWMGGDKNARDNERPRHQVTLDAYAIAQYPTTNAMYARFIADGGYANADWWGEAIADGYWKEGTVKEWLSDKWRGHPYYWEDTRWNNPSQPVVGVNWYEAVAYCRWLTVCMSDGNEYRLLTEAEWERAARWGSAPPTGEKVERVYPWGDEWREGYCNSEEAQLAVTSPVGLFPLGAAAGKIHDMVGNVYEWCGDWYGEDYYAQSENAHNPQGPRQGTTRVLRGGAWSSTGSSNCRCGFRGRLNPGLRFSYRGFRCVRISPPNP